MAIEAHRLYLEELNRPKERPVWDKVEGEFRKTKPLLKTLKHNKDDDDDVYGGDYSSTADEQLADMGSSRFQTSFNASTLNKHSKSNDGLGVAQ